MSANGTGLPTPAAGTSKIYPWFFDRSPLPMPSVVSSHVSHDPHGVGPPAQFANGPADARPAREVTPAQGVEFERHGSTPGLGVVGERRRERIGTVADLVVANEPETAVAGRKRGHAVVHAGRLQAVVHQLARPAKRQVSKVGRQVQQWKPRRFVDRGLQRTVVRTRPASLPRVLRPAREQGIERRGDRQRACGDGGAREKITASDACAG
jgi:hypothetical protein